MWFNKRLKVKVCQLCPTLCNPIYTVHGILQARLLEWVAFPFSRGSSQPRERTQVSHIAAGFLTSWATREVQTLKGSLQNYIPQRLTKGQKWSPWSFCFSVLINKFFVKIQHFQGGHDMLYQPRHYTQVSIWEHLPVFLPVKSYGQRSLAGYSPRGHKRVRHELGTKQ